MSFSPLAYADTRGFRNAYPMSDISWVNKNEDHRNDGATNEQFHIVVRLAACTRTSIRNLCS